jgi:glutamyl/glutaminyl-tRNA synthetase
VAAYRELGYLPAGMVNFLALLGWAYDDKAELFTLAELERVFRLERVSRNPAVFNLEKLEWLNGQHLKRLSDDQRTELVTRFLAGRGFDLSRHPAAWWTALVRTLGERVRTLADVEIHGAFVLHDELETEPVAWGELLGRPAAGPWLDQLAAALESDPDFSLESLERVTRGLAATLGVKPGELMAAARVALTGRKTAPGLFEVMRLLGRALAVRRLRDAAARWGAESAHAGG